MAAAPFQFETEDFAGRMNFSATMFLSTFAVLYVVGGSLPKTDFLTAVDQIIVLTLVTQLAIALSCLIDFKLFTSGQHELAQRTNSLFLNGTIMMYIIINMAILLPVCFGRYVLPTKTELRRKKLLASNDSTDPTAYSRISGSWDNADQDEKQANLTTKYEPLKD